MEAVVHYATREELVAVAGHVVVRIIEGHNTKIADLQRLEGMVAEVFDERDWFGVLQIHCHGTPMAPAPVLRYSAELMDRWAERACVVVAAIGLGFWAAMMRSGVEALRKLTGRSHIHLAPDVPAAAQLLARELIGTNSEALVEICAELQTRMRALGPDERIGVQHQA